MSWVRSVLGPKCLYTFWDDVAHLLQLSTHLSDCLYRVSFRRYNPLTLPLSCEVVEKGGWFVGEEIPQILDMRFQVALSSDHATDFRWVPFSDSEIRGRNKEEEEEEEEESMVKYKSAPTGMSGGLISDAQGIVIPEQPRLRSFNGIGPWQTQKAADKFFLEAQWSKTTWGMGDGARLWVRAHSLDDASKRHRERWLPIVKLNALRKWQSCRPI